MRHKRGSTSLDGGLNKGEHCLADRITRRDAAPGRSDREASDDRRVRFDKRDARFQS
jgi:hypothetical protein